MPCCGCQLLRVRMPCAAMCCDVAADGLWPVRCALWRCCAVQKLFPALLNILTHKPPYSPRVQARTVAVYRRCGKGLYHLRFESKLDEGPREFLAPTLGPWMDVFGQLLDPSF